MIKYFKVTRQQFRSINFFIVALGFGVQSCNNPPQQTKTISEKWYKKEIILPQKLVFKSMGQDTACTHILNQRHKVLVYLDSVGCIPCRLRLVEWKEYIEDCQSRGLDVGFLFVVQSSNYKHLEEKLYTDLFSYPIIYDSKDDFNKLNKFPKEEKFRTFLLDEKNRVVLIGSPIENEKIRMLYGKVIGNGKKVPIAKLDNKQAGIPIGQTNVQLTIDSLSLGKFRYSSVKQCSFALKNIGSKPLVIQSVRTACGCTVAKYDKKPLAVGQTATILLEYKPNSLGYFSKTADVVCNVPKGHVRLKISGEVVEK